MAVYVVTGRLGSGKTLCAVGRIREYLSQGRPVATNLDLELSVLVGARSCATVTRLPDKPRLSDMEMLGAAQETYAENSTGLVVLDECATWLNSRDWNDKERAALLGWFLHSRKLGWDVLFLIQDAESMDKQLRQALCEHTVVCRRLDRLAVPFFGVLAKLVGMRLRMPQVHVATVWYSRPGEFKSDRWWYRGTDLFDAYDTRQVFVDDVQILGESLVDMRAPFTVLSPWLVQGRYLSSPVSLLRRIGSRSLRAFTIFSVFFGAACTGRSPVQVASAWGLIRRKPA